MKAEGSWSDAELTEAVKQDEGLMVINVHALLLLTPVYL